MINRKAPIFFEIPDQNICFKEASLYKINISDYFRCFEMP